MGTRIRRLAGAAAVVLGVAGSAAAQSAHSGALHRGVVYDQRGAPLPGVVVTLEHPQDKGVRVALTDLWGEYAVADLDRGTRYIVRISHPGFEGTRLKAAAGDHINVTLKPRRPARAGGLAPSAVARR